MKKNRRNRIFGLLLTLSLFVSANTVSYAASGEMKGNAGSVSVIARAGFNGGNVYANYNASDYVDARIIGSCRFTAASGVSGRDFSSNFEQRTYGAVEINYPNTVIHLICTYKVYSNDGNWVNSIRAGSEN